MAQLVDLIDTLATIVCMVMLCVHRQNALALASEA